MLSLLNIALKNLLVQKKIKRIEFDDRDFVAYQHSSQSSSNHPFYIYTKNVINLHPDKKGVFDDIFDESSNLHMLINSRYYSAKSTPTSIYLPIEYHGNNKSHLGSLSVSFTVLLEVKVDTRAISLNIYSPDDFGPDDQFGAFKKKILEHCHFIRRESIENPREVDFNVASHYLNHHSNFSTKGVATRTDVWIMVYAAKLMEDKDRLYNDGKAISSFKADPLFKTDESLNKADISASLKAKQNGLFVNIPKNKNSTNTDKSPLDYCWSSEWSVDVAALDPKPVILSMQTKLIVSEASNITKKVSPVESDVKKEVKSKLSMFSEVKLPIDNVAQAKIVESDINRYSLERFRRDVTVTLSLIDQHITTLNDELKFQNNISESEKKLKMSKILALKSILNGFPDREDFKDDNVRNVVSDIIEQYPECKKGFWSGYLFKSRTGNLLDDLLKIADKYSSERITLNKNNKA